MISKILGPILNVFKFHKKKVLVLLGLYLFFLYLVFPFNDLGDLVAQKVSELSGGQVFVNFDSLGFGLLPEPGLNLSNVVVETAFTPRLTAKELSLAPSIAGLLAFKPGITARAESLLGGDVYFSTRGGEKTSNGKGNKQKIEIELSSLDLRQITDMAQSPVRLNGNVSGTANTQVDLSFVDQPVADIDLSVAKGILNESQINTDLGPLPLPRLNLNDVSIQGHMEKGALDVTKAVIGKPGGDVYANVTGKLDVRMEKLGNSVNPRMGGYDFTVKLQVGETLRQKMSAFLGFLASYQTSPNNYSFRVSAPSTMVPPNFTKAQ